MPRCSTSAPVSASTFLPPILRRQIQIRGPHQVADAAALVRLFDARPEAIEFAAQQIRLVEQHGRVRQQIEHCAIGPGDRSVKLPAGKHRHSAGTHRRFNDLFRSGNALARKPRVDRAQQLIADRSLGQRQQQSFIHRIRRPLRRRIEAPDRLHFIAEKLDAHRALRLRRIHIQNAAAQRVLSGHLDHIGRAIANGVQVCQKIFDDRTTRRAAARGPGRCSSRPSAAESPSPPPA